MQGKSLVPALFLSCFLLNIFSSPPVSAGARVDLRVEHGVDKEAEAQARTAVNAIIDFFHNTYGLSLDKNLQIVIAGDKRNYKDAIKQWFGSSDARASLQSTISSGLQSRGTIVINMGDIHQDHRQLYVLCHEIVHHFQNQASPEKYGAIRWLTEGVANVIAAHIMTTAGIKGSVDYQKKWLAALKKARTWPTLDKLHSGRDWYAAMQSYDYGVTYGTASLAVMTLVQWRGYKPLFAYFTALKQTGPEEAFYQAFGARLADFEKQFRPL